MFVDVLSRLLFLNFFCKVFDTSSWLGNVKLAIILHLINAFKAALISSSRFNHYNISVFGKYHLKWFHSLIGLLLCLVYEVIYLALKL